MLHHDIVERCGIGLADHIILIDPDLLWDRANIASVLVQEGYRCTFADDAVELRYQYELYAASDNTRWLIRYTGGYIPYDIGQSTRVVDISLNTLFPRLHIGVLRSCTNIDIELVSAAYKDVYSRLGSDDTEDFCTGTIWKPKYLEQVCFAYKQECDLILPNEMKAKQWGVLADRIGFMLTAQRCEARLEWFDKWYQAVYAKFSEWMASDYKKLYTMPVKSQPWILSQVLDYIRRKKKSKVAVLLMDGMSYADYHLIRRDLVRSDFCFNAQFGILSFVPSITSVARQAIFSGKRPVDHEKPFSLDNEERQWREFWKNHGIKDNDIEFTKSEEPEWTEHTRALGIVINIVDDLMHSNLQGGNGMRSDMQLWLEKGNLNTLIHRLIEDGFTIFVTADHGNTVAIGQGLFKGTSVAMERASRRAFIYHSGVGTDNLDKYDLTEYCGAYMPTGYRYLSFAPHTCYGNKGTEYISHGGMTIEEMIVPFMQIGD